MRIFGIVGWKNSGKTGLMERLVAEITGRGFSVSTMKHAHHTFDVDHAGKDSHRHRLAGASEVLLASKKRWALMNELREQDEPSMHELLSRLSPCDLVLIEGFKRDGHAKIEVNLTVTGQDLIARNDKTICAIASDQMFAELDLEQFNLDDTGVIADFILLQTGLVSDVGKTDELPNVTAPRLNNGCFALPPGVNWMPVDEALDLLQSGIVCVVTQQDDQAVPFANGEVLAKDVVALRSNPPGANSAVDGYGVSHSFIAEGANVFPLLEERSAAGTPFLGKVPAGHAIRILTGALLPEGVDTIVMQEDVNIADGHVAFSGPIKERSNARKAGEDVAMGQTALQAGHVLRAPDLALLTGLGVANVPVLKKLRVGVLSTGDEIVAADGGVAPLSNTYDANRPMLLAMIEKWGHHGVDLGQVNDERGLLRGAFNAAAEQVDVVLTTGGASAGDEDHVSALLKDEGRLNAWRIALKPGRPLVLAQWKGVPVFGLPGNPVAAFVTALIFARPSLSLMAGAGWLQPQGFMVPAAFEKNKKAGRREYLRARINEVGQVEIFQSEGSGRISGLSWADGLVELSDDAQEISHGSLVRYIPYSSFGL